MNGIVAERVTVALGLGSNLGDRKAYLSGAIDGLASNPSIDVTAVSAIYETPPWGRTNQPVFLNAAVLVETDLTPRALLRAVLRIERSLGRVRDELWGPRTIDIDILLYGDEHIDEPGLTIPHPRIRERAFVLCPLAALVPDAIIAGRPVSDWLKALDLSGIRTVEEPGWYKAD